jgi:exopolysaccharide production protein ExoY
MSVSGLLFPVPGEGCAAAAVAAPGRLWNWIERALAAGALALALPVLLPAALAVVVLSGRTPLVAHERVGHGGRRFWMLKLRTMWNEPRGRGWPHLVEYVVTEGVPGPKPDPDPRVTSRLARLLRRYSVDELPQLVHVLTGRMALVGPRPLVAAELETYYGADAAEVLSVKPGITGLWQVCGRSRLDYAERRRLDLYLVRHRSVRLYLRILARTIPVVVFARDSW